MQKLFCKFTVVKLQLRIPIRLERWEKQARVHLLVTDVIAHHAKAAKQGENCAKYYGNLFCLTVCSWYIQIRLIVSDSGFAHTVYVLLLLDISSECWYCIYSI